MFATPERNLVFDMNDFDETLPAPREWDVKRLGTSFAVAARVVEFIGAGVLLLGAFLAAAAFGWRLVRTPPIDARERS